MRDIVTFNLQTILRHNLMKIKLLKLRSNKMCFRCKCKLKPRTVYIDQQIEKAYGINLCVSCLRRIRDVFTKRIDAVEPLLLGGLAASHGAVSLLLSTVAACEISIFFELFPSIH